MYSGWCPECGTCTAGTIFPSKMSEWCAISGLPETRWRGSGGQGTGLSPTLPFTCCLTALNTSLYTGENDTLLPLPLSRGLLLRSFPVSLPFLMKSIPSTWVFRAKMEEGRVTENEAAGLWLALHVSAKFAREPSNSFSYAETWVETQ